MPTSQDLNNMQQMLHNLHYNDNPPYVKPKSDELVKREHFARNVFESHGRRPYLSKQIVPREITLHDPNDLNDPNNRLVVKYNGKEMGPFLNVDPRKQVVVFENGEIPFSAYSNGEVKAIPLYINDAPGSEHAERAGDNYRKTFGSSLGGKKHKYKTRRDKSRRDKTKRNKTRRNKTRRDKK